jgi:hypothetical protein
MMIDQDEVKDEAQEPVCVKRYYHLDHVADLFVQIRSSVQLQDC